jgi:hypothetical protein
MIERQKQRAATAMTGLRPARRREAATQHPLPA